MPREERHSWLSGYVPHAKVLYYPGAPAVAQLVAFSGLRGCSGWRSPGQTNLYHTRERARRAVAAWGDPAMPGCHSGASPLPPVSFLCLKARSAQSFFHVARNEGAGKRGQVGVSQPRIGQSPGTRSVISHRQAAPWPPGQSCVIRRHCMACWRCCSGLRPSTSRAVIRAQSSRTRRLRQLRVSASTTRQKAGPKGQAASSCSRS